MKHITLLYPEGQCNLGTIACIVGTVEIFSRANTYWIQEGNKQKYQLAVAGTRPKKEYINDLVALKTDVYITDIYRSATNVWSSTFRQTYPKVNLHSDKLITDEKGVYTNGGAYSFLNLVLYLIEKYYDRQTAIYCSKVFQIELDRNSQSSFAIFNGQKQHGDAMVQQAQLYIENNVNKKIAVEDMSSIFAIGRRNFDRRFIKATGNTPIAYAQRVKIESAKKALESTRKTINEVMYEVGYADVKAFREVFRKITGLSPLEYKNKFNKESFTQY